MEWDEVRFDVRLMQRVPCMQPRSNPQHCRQRLPPRCSPACFVVRRRGHVAHADVFAEAPARSRRAPRSRHDDRVGLLRHRRRPPVRIPASNSTPSNAHRNRNAFLFSGTLPISSSPSATASRRCVSPEAVSLNPSIHQHTAHPSLARAQTCNFDVLYAYLSTPFPHRTRSPPQ